MTTGIGAGSRIVYYYDDEIGNFHYGEGHPMKPFRIQLTNNLMINYQLYKSMQIYRPRLIKKNEILKFHNENYISYLEKLTPKNYKKYYLQLQQFNIGPNTDCPIFDGMFEFNQRSIGGSLDGALRLAYNYTDIAINWAGGFHHAKKSEASGFCYINDIVLAILELLKYYARVLYIDIDIHHGDGCEEAFYSTNRVLCFSLHKHGHNFFPGTGHYKDIGVRDGKYYSINYPFMNGIKDEQYLRVFETLLNEIFSKYQPSCCVLQCGADSLVGDRIGLFNISTVGHGSIISYVKNLCLGGKIPLLCVGGGGYNIRNVARCWTYETSLLCGKELSNTIPYSAEFMHYFKPDFKLHVECNERLKNENTKKSLEDMTNIVLQQIGRIEISPSVHLFQEDIPPPSLVNSVEKVRADAEFVEDMNVECDRESVGCVVENDQVISAKNDIFDDDKEDK